LDYIPIERTTLTDKTKKAYGNSFPEEEIRSIMGRAIPPEWTVNLLALGKEPWRFKDLEYQLNMYCQQWQADQQKQISRSRSLQRCLKRCQTNQMIGKEKKVKEIITIQLVVAVAVARTIMAEEDAEEAAEEATIVSIWKMLNVSIVAKRFTILPTAHLQERMTIRIQTWYPKRISKIYFNLLWKTCWPKRKNRQRRRTAWKSMINHWTWMFLKNSWKVSTYKLWTMVMIT
jgi:hypothetical protein